ncbi:6-hydroxypseudooxynicotine dehydrogenase complex subunit alpha [Rubrobacter xylanophilus DSM 9941]|uniref:FAD binding domain-containing protein n=1 Tax=Rubrobacter xylanophilus TaxID=49319 RepID=UPI0022777455|nr:xanthine dehydrogenase family protein subunit M [Rubrobacter xylanophilus]QYJ16607.1 6-hydroxypseudooxynicotine dehydrogenase complex subunit alpha [Rubrobacter xylanophilus DSM 9941]
MAAPQWHEPRSLEEALSLRAEHGEEATLVAGGSFLGIVMNQRLFSPTMLVALRSISELDFIEAGGETLRLGAMATHRAVERSPVVREGWPSLAYTFSVVASPRVRNQATVGGVVADADYASDPPSMLAALGARVVARSVRGEREIPMQDFVLGHYETALEEDEMVTEVRIPRSGGRSVYRKFRSRSGEDRPCVSVAAARDGGLRVVVGAVAGRPQYFPEICELARGETMSGGLAAEIGRRYADAIEPLSDARGSARYRRRVIAVEVRRALEDLYDG